MTPWGVMGGFLIGVTGRQKGMFYFFALSQKLGYKGYKYR